MDKRGKKGWLKILEASLSMGMIMGFVVLVYSQGIERPNPGEAVLAWQGNILDELKDKVVLRDAVLNKGDTTCLVGGEVYNYTKEKVLKIFPGFGFECRVCGPGDICGAKYAPVERGEIYSEQRIISSTLQKFDPKKIKLFIFPLQKGETQENLVEKRMNETTNCWPGQNYNCPLDWTCNLATSKWERQCTDACAGGAPNMEHKEEAGCPLTAPDLTAPGIITLLSCSGSTPTSSITITCIWTTPSDSDFKETVVYYGTNAPQSIVSGPNTQKSYTTSTITSSGQYTFNFRTKDNAGNENAQAGTKTCTVAYQSGKGYTSC